jgi:hypothetical protein
MRDLNRRRKSAYGPEPNGIATTNTLAHGCKADFAVSSICPDMSLGSTASATTGGRCRRSVQRQ